MVAEANFQETDKVRFSCEDHPYVMINFTISIKYYRNYAASLDTSIDKNSAYNIWARFNITDKISLYHTATVLADIEYFYANWWCRQSVKQQIEFAQTMAEKATLCLKHLFFNIRFIPFKVDYIVIPGFRDVKDMGSLGFILYRYILFSHIL